MYNNGNSSKNVTGSSVVDGTLENADFPDDTISGDKIDGGTISDFASTGIDDNATSTAITIDSSENVGINGKLTSTSTSNGTWGSVSVGTDYAKSTRVTSGAGYVDFFYTGTGSTYAGYIYASGGTTTYATASDYRLKENVVPMTGSIDRLKNLSPSKFNFIGEDRTVDGFLAHEAQEVVPESVHGTKDAMTAEVLYTADDELPEGKNIGDVKEASVPEYQGIDQSKLVPLLVSALQEAIARIETLENA